MECVKGVADDNKMMRPEPKGGIVHSKTGPHASRASHADASRLYRGWTSSADLQIKTTLYLRTFRIKQSQQVWM
jgi:hypothetical protein